MRVAFHASEGKKFDEAIADAFEAGCRAYGVKAFRVPTADWVGEPHPKADLGVVVGVKDKSGPIFQAYRRAGRPAVFVDKGYTRIRGGPNGTLYWRVSVNAFQPLAYFQSVRRPADRWDALRLRHPYGRRQGDKVLFAGSSQKYCDWQGLGPATAYAEKVLAEIRRHTDRPIVYRPKPSWKDAVPIDGSEYSPDADKFVTRLEEAHCLVTYGSNACFEAVLAGVPAIVLGDGITRPVCATDVSKVEYPDYPDRPALRQLCYDVAYCQWTLDEMAAGLCWANVTEVLQQIGG